ncbi:MAG: patatin-like phospholipase family protein [Methylophilus sp.]|jgi:uncharacterized protein
MNMLTPSNANTVILEKQHFNVLALDGGGTKGVYTLGVLKELEAHLQKPLYQHFDLIYGTSTGSIIASLLALGKTVTEIEAIYFQTIPQIMAQTSRAKRSKEIRLLATNFFKQAKFDAFKTHIGIVTTHDEYHSPVIFRTQANISTEYAFDSTIADAVVASCAAYPFFEASQIKSVQGASLTLLDGGMVANNPSLLAITDAIRLANTTRNKIRVLSVGVGHYPIPKYVWYKEIGIKLIKKRLGKKRPTNNSQIVETIRKMLYPNIAYIRIDDTFKDAQYATSMLDNKLSKLKAIHQLGRISFEKYKPSILDLFS